MFLHVRTGVSVAIQVLQLSVARGDRVLVISLAVMVVHPGQQPAKCTATAAAASASEPTLPSMDAEIDRMAKKIETLSEVYEVPVSQIIQTLVEKSRTTLPRETSKREKKPLPMVMAQVIKNYNTQMPAEQRVTTEQRDALLNLISQVEVDGDGPAMMVDMTEDTILEAGKHAGKTILKVCEADPDYLKWILHNVRPNMNMELRSFAAWIRERYKLVKVGSCKGEDLLCIETNTIMTGTMAGRTIRPPDAQQASASS
jgi:hypothetical protein